MDFLLDDETIKKMNAEYGKLLKSTAKTLSTADDSENKTRMRGLHVRAIHKVFISLHRRVFEI